MALEQVSTGRGGDSGGCFRAVRDPGSLGHWVPHRLDLAWVPAETRADGERSSSEADRGTSHPGGGGLFESFEGVGRLSGQGFDSPPRTSGPADSLGVAPWRVPESEALNVWPFRKQKGKHRKSDGADVEQKLRDVTKEHERASTAVTVKANRLGAAADRLIASNRQALRDAARGGG